MNYDLNTTKEDDDTDTSENSIISLSSSSSDSSFESTTSTNSKYDKVQCQEANKMCCKHFANIPPDSDYASKVKNWTARVPICLGLCPWAVKSSNKGHLRYVTCHSDNIADVAKLIVKEGELLLETNAPAFSSTLLVCPNVEAWNDFSVFEEWVRYGIAKETNDELYEDLTFVPFHPNFLRWYDLPKDVGIGSNILSHWGNIGYKSPEKSPATIIETSNRVFGLQKVKVRFHHDDIDDRRQTQYVPIGWIEFQNKKGNPLPDNIMHRAPYPTIHLIDNKDLVSMPMRDISRVKRKNAQLMMRLGWEGIERRLKETS